MFETTPPTPDGCDCAESRDLAELDDPIGSVIAIELSRAFVRRTLCWAEPVVSELAGQETMLRKPGGVELAKHLMSQRLYRRMDAEVFHLVRRCVPLEHAAFALAGIEEALRARFAEVVETAATHLLSHDREVAIQMAAVATTMVGREVTGEIAGIIADARPAGDAEGS